jgi:hypothetical protein
MPTATIKTNVTIAGTTYVSTITRTKGQLILCDFSATGELALPAANAGVCTRSDANTGVITLTTGHTIVNGKVDVYWTESGVVKIRRGMDATVATNDVTVDGGAGNDLCATAATAVTIAMQVPFTIAFSGDALAALVISNTKRCSVELTGSLAGADGLDIPANEGMSWASGTMVTNPCAGDTITAGIASCGEATAGDLFIIALVDNS